MCGGGGGGGAESSQIKSSTSLFHSKEKVGVTHQ